MQQLCRANTRTTDTSGKESQDSFSCLLREAKLAYSQKQTSQRYVSIGKALAKEQGWAGAGKRFGNGLW